MAGPLASRARDPDQLLCLFGQTPHAGHQQVVQGFWQPGVQLAAELQRSGRPVTLSVGEHVRLPRVYRGRDVLWWLDASGVWGQRYDEVEDLTRARRLPSPQLVGTPERAMLDLNALTSMGVELVGCNRYSAASRRGDALRRLFARVALHRAARQRGEHDASGFARRVGPA